jgi:basic membrane protein A
MVIATTFNMYDVLEINADFPDTIFLTWGGVGLLDNMGQYDGASEEGRYLDGLIAGMVTETDIIGYVGGFGYEEINRSANAFTMGVREVNPDAVVRLVYINSWWDPPVEQQAAQALVDAGADVLSHELNSLALPSVAEDNGIHVSGYGFDQFDNLPNSWLSSFVWNWGAYYESQIQLMIDGNWEATQFYGGLGDNMITMSRYGPDVPQEAIDLVEQRMQQIIDGEFDIFAGPISDNQGNVVIAEGETIPFYERAGCCLWLIEGIEGAIPEG